ncbi:antitoxin of toxin-antitoxin stability system [Sandaracinobacter sp. RS1-74]|uniref:antitoxin of toxin-antitoxin stability system n=1 Tax=Sandaracinobacteroides sayramensis TaxID=2913411 RepID=UPI001EDAFE66|nr:antitoxin of toxin-antitoxin stability system [Sandaracinobacteroides sayramensis]MCG2841273.1 antitoxin of toxin-antitoxin stability system [Sandaracinobacteroides sayramensis]
MPKIIEITVFRFEELAARAREKARDWYRQTGLDYDWHDYHFDDFERICEILGVTLLTSPVELHGGGTRPRPHIYFSGFSSQGDGACFEGDYSYAKLAPARIRAYAPRDKELHRIASALQAIQQQNGYQLHARIDHRGRYYHEHSMTISVERNSPTEREPTANAAGSIEEALRDLARWLYRQLEREYDYLNSDKAVDEAIRANEYTFTAEGARFG